MRVDIRDVDSVKALNPLEIASYLRASNWTQADVSKGRYAVWVLHDDVEAMVPLRTDTADYALRMGDLLRTLSVVEDRSQAELLTDLLTTNADVVRLRLVDDDLSDGSMPIEDYTRTTQKARDLLMAAACSAIQPRAVWPNRKPDEAMGYLRGVRMGQTERGSYVLKIISRVPPKLASTQARLGFAEGQEEELEDEPFARRVTTTLASGLSQAESAAAAAAASGTVDEFESAVASGVSANFCEALAGLADDGDSRRRVDVSFTWARTRPNRAEVAQRVTLSPDRVPFLREAARVLRDRSPVEGFELKGPVTKLERTDTSGPGIVTVHALVDQTVKRVRLELTDTDYTMAVEAHGEGRDIACTGRLVREGRSFTLKNPANVLTSDGD